MKQKILFTPPFLAAERASQLTGIAGVPARNVRQAQRQESPRWVSFDKADEWRTLFAPGALLRAGTPAIPVS
ncbi:MAG TPA: hypothetical protein VLL54_14515 [Pyrinomonadaceae bacterium]|nr:hypothetical protein [Pyrinomonadaceae bacterium]